MKTRPVGSAWLMGLVVSMLACGPGVGSGADTGTASGGSSGPGDTTNGSQTGSTGSTGSTGPGPTGVDTTAGSGPTPLELHIEAYCMAWLSVECPWPRYDSVEECIEHYGAELAPWAAQAEAGTAVFDEACGAIEVMQIQGEELECVERSCRVFHGFLEQGDLCELDYSAKGTECGEGLSCAPCVGLFCDSTCEPRCATVGDGEACHAAACDEGLWCVEVGDVEPEEFCEPMPGPGDPCSGGLNPCPLDLWCDDGTCSDQYAGVGESCADTPCDVAVAFCQADVCAPQLPLGSPCTVWYQCQSTACVQDQCAPLPDTVGAACHQHKRCADELECDVLTRTCREPYPSFVCNVQSWCPTYGFPDDVCDEGDGPDQCPPNTDPSDCGYCPETRQGDGECDETLYCAEGTDPDCP